ncbi:general transcription factor 3C polypeptide 6-like [Pecten maximus]|uniref:general transcription factor 3C polypeptide 6-like n=1 Tax=Pecten maximus TaxID=6579 RepID=UPI0014586843|nr:general transcription factor 3C polypeptide 6-like [Pecten maximus]
MAEHTGNLEECGEWEEEETTVVVELSGILESDFISQCDGDCKVLGINTDNPLLQLDRYTFSGEYADTTGTNLIFTQGDAIDEEPSHFHETADKPTKNLEYLCKVDKKLNMSRVFVSRTHGDEEDKDSGENSAIEEGSGKTDTNINPDISNTDATAMSVDTESTLHQLDSGAPTEPQLDTLSAGSGSQMDTSSVVTIGPQTDTSQAVPDYLGPEIVLQCDSDG